MKKYKFSLICATCLVTLTSVSWGSGQGGDMPTGFFDRIGSIFRVNNQGENPPQIPQMQILAENPHRANNQQPQNLTQIYQEESSDEENQGSLSFQPNRNQIHCEESSDEENEAQLLEAKKRRGQWPQGRGNRNQDSDEEILVPCSQRESPRGDNGSRQSRSGSDELHMTDYGDFLIWRNENNREGVLTQRREVMSQNSFEKKKEGEEQNMQEDTLMQQQTTLSQPPFEKKSEENQGGEQVKSPKKKRIKKQVDESSQQEFTTTYLQQIYPQLFLHQQFSSHEPESNSILTPQEKMRLAIKKAQEGRQKQGGLTIQRKKKKK